MAKYEKKDARTYSREIFKGVWAAVTTPFKDDLSLDEEGIRYNVRYCKNLGITGIFTNGIIGEFWTLTFEEKKRAIKAAVDESIKQGIKTIVQTGSTSAQEVVDLSNYADECGADVVCIIPPFFNSGQGAESVWNDRLAFNFFDYIQKRISIGFWIFDTTYTGRKLSDDFYERLANTAEHFVGIKQGRGYDAFCSLQDRVGDRLIVASPVEPLLYRYITERGLGVFMANPTPLEIQTIDDPKMIKYATAAWSGDLEVAKRGSDELEPVRELVRKYHGIDNYEGVVPIQYHKAWMELLGLKAGPVRPPLPNLSPDEKAALKKDLISVGLIKE